MGAGDKSVKGWLTHLHECVLTLNRNMGVTEECFLKVDLSGGSRDEMGGEDSSLHSVPVSTSPTWEWTEGEPLAGLVCGQPARSAPW